MARIVILVLLAVVAVYGLDDNILIGPNAIEGRYIASLKGIKNNQDFDTFKSSVARLKFAKVLRTFDLGHEKFALIEATDKTRLSEITKLQNVRFMESDEEVRAEDPLDFAEVPTGHSRARRAVPSGDRKCSAEYQLGRWYDWGIVRTSHRGLPDSESAPYVFGNDDGAGVDIYIVDTGIFLEHTDFEGRAVWGMTGDDIYARGEGDEDLNGHGTHVAGTAAGKMYGVARKSTLIACKVLGANSSGSWADSIQALEWIVNRMRWQRSVGVVPRAVINMSLGGFSDAYSTIAAMQAAIDEGALISTSAGNSRIDACYYSPARLATAMTVAASNINDDLASFSNFGPCVNIIAPGRNITGPFIGYDTRYVYISGTSMAAPHVAGVAARHLSMYADNEVPTSMELRATIIDQTTRGLIDLPGNDLGSTPNHLLYKECDPRPKPTMAQPPHPEPEPVKNVEVVAEAEAWPEIPECPQQEKVNWPNDTLYSMLLGVLVLVCIALLQHILVVIGLLRIKSRCSTC